MAFMSYVHEEESIDLFVQLRLSRYHIKSSSQLLDGVGVGWNNWLEDYLRSPRWF